SGPSYSQRLCQARPVVNGTSEPDLLLETSCSCSFSRCPFRRPPPLSAVQTGPPELALYSLTERANSPFHVEPAQFPISREFHVATGSCKPSVRFLFCRCCSSISCMTMYASSSAGRFR